MHCNKNNPLGKFDGNSDTHGCKMYKEIVNVCSVFILSHDEFVLYIFFYFLLNTEKSGKCTEY